MQWGLLLCDPHGRRFGSKNERVHSCGFTDLWSYKYPVCGQLCSSSIHNLLPTAPGQEKEHINTNWSGRNRGVCVDVRKVHITCFCLLVTSSHPRRNHLCYTVSQLGVRSRFCNPNHMCNTLLRFVESSFVSSMDSNHI